MIKPIKIFDIEPKVEEPKCHKKFGFSGIITTPVITASGGIAGPFTSNSFYTFTTTNGVGGYTIVNNKPAEFVQLNFKI